MSINNFFPLTDVQEMDIQEGFDHWSKFFVLKCSKENSFVTLDDIPLDKLQQKSFRLHKWNEICTSSGGAFQYNEANFRCLTDA